MRKTALSALAAGVSLALVPLVASASDSVGIEEDLGTPITFTNTASAGYTTGADGRPIITTIAGGDPSVFSAVDAATGELLYSEEVAGVTIGLTYTTGSDRSVYIGSGSGGRVWRFDPDAMDVELLGERVFGQTHWFSNDTGPDGRIWFGTYPDAKLISYQPTTQDWTDHGTLQPGATYARTVAAWQDKVFVGVTPHPAIYEYDTVTGAARKIELPAEYQGDGIIYGVDVRGSKLFALLTPVRTLLVYDLETDTWIEEIPRVAGHGMAPVREVSVPDGSGGTELRSETYYVSQADGSQVVGYDVETGAKRQLPLVVEASATGGWEWMELGKDEYPGESLVAMDRFARIYQWNPQTNASTVFTSDAAGSPVHIRSMATGPDGAIYLGGYASNAGLARYDPETGETELLPGPGQIETITTVGDHVLFGVYASALVYDYDTTRPWQFGTNPATPARLGHEQDRPTAFVQAGDLTAVASVPAPGHLGGALTLLDRDTGEFDVYRDVVPDQSPLTLAYHDGLIYGGTGIWGGLGIDPTTTEGSLFVFDPVSREVVHTSVPVPGERNVSGLAFDDDGMLWGITGNELFKFDPATREVVLRKKYFSVNDSETYWVGRSLHWADGKLVGMTSRKAFEIDTETLELTVLSDLGGGFAAGTVVGGDGAYYYSEGARLYRWTPEARANCATTITGAVRGRQVVTGPGLTCVHDADVKGVLDVRAGAGLDVRDSTLRGVVRTHDSASVSVVGSRLSGSVSITGTRGGVLLSHNVIDGALRCAGNAEPPTDDGVPNTGRGPRSGQCAHL